jgi:hypothetical protein
MLSTKTLIINYCLAFFIGRIPGRLLGKFTPLLETNIDPNLGWQDALSQTYLPVVLALLLWAGILVYVFCIMAKRAFSMPLFFKITGAFCVIGIAAFWATITGTVDPRVMLLGLGLQFAVGLWLVVQDNKGQPAI